MWNLWQQLFLILHFLQLEGKAIIDYEGQDYELNAGESFRFDKNGLHSVTPQGKFKMSLLLVIE